MSICWVTSGKKKQITKHNIFLLFSLLFRTWFPVFCHDFLTDFHSFIYKIFSLARTWFSTFICPSYSIFSHSTVFELRRHLEVTINLFFILADFYFLDFSFMEMDGDGLELRPRMGTNFLCIKKTKNSKKITHFLFATIFQHLLFIGFVWLTILVKKLYTFSQFSCSISFLSTSGRGCIVFLL